MKKYFLLIILLLMTIPSIPVSAESMIAEKDISKEEYTIKTKQNLLTFMMAYKDDICDLEKDDSGNILVIMKSGKKILYDDKKEKNSQDMIYNSDLEDMLKDSYPLNMINELMEVNNDPGRYRNYTFLKEVYGYNEGSVKKNLVGVYAPYNKFLFNKNNGAAESLKSAMSELKDIAKNNGRVAEIIGNINGTFNYRTVAETGLLSAHAFGIAIDVAVNPSDFWKWSSREAGQKRMLYFPKEMIETMEKYNFIWGGKWGHFDIMHFEYRPEIVMKSRYFGDGKTFDKDNWFKGVPENEETLKCIKRINEIVD